MQDNTGDGVVGRGAGSLTPAMAQYWSIKEQHKDAIVLFHIGDFYETFGEDAETISRELDIVLTSRSKDRSGAKIPLAGVPCHAVEGYIARLIGKGYRVALADQVEDPRNAKGIVKREVVRVISPGMVMDEALIGSKGACYLMAIIADDRGREEGLAFLDISTGEFFGVNIPVDSQHSALVSEIARYRPAECLVVPAIPPGITGVLGDCGVLVTRCREELFDPDSAARTLKEQFGVASLQGFGMEENPLVLRSAGAVLRYARENQRSDLRHINGFSIKNPEDSCVLDAVSLRNLEILESVRGGDQQMTLCHVLDRTMTPMGSRLFKNWLRSPLVSVARINGRLDSVEFFLDNTGSRAKVREGLHRCSDIERIAGRISCGSAGPRDLLALQQTLERLPGLKQVIRSTPGIPSAVDKACEEIADLSWMSSLIARAIPDDPPVTLKKGGVLRNGYDAQLDELRGLASSGKEWIMALQQKERERTGIKSLKIGYNSVFGYYIEVTKSNLSLVPAWYERKQTTTGGERFTIPELKEKEAAIAMAEERLLALENERYRALLEKLAEGVPGLHSISRGISILDVFAALAEAAAMYHYRRPVLDETHDILIRGGRHPVVESVLQSRFVPNDTQLCGSDDQILIITGANMAGKSTYMRGVALITLMAQMGSYVPADHARIGIVDRIFTRVGAFDDLASGQSTFMVEMIELANILNNVTNRSLVVLDEIGRGTSTLDGYCIARSVLEFLHGRGSTGPRTLFATHFHELVAAETDLKRVKNYHFAVKDTGKEVVFLWKIIPGATDRSYGIHVASIAGVPKKVTGRAAALLDAMMRREGHEGHGVRRYTQMLIIDTPAPAPDPLTEMIRDLKPDTLSPREALELIYEIKKKAGGGG